MTIDPAKLTEPMTMVKAVATRSKTGAAGPSERELDQSHDRRRATAHAVEQGDQLRHLGHLHPVRADGTDGGSDGDRGQDRDHVLQVGGDEHQQHRQHGTGRTDQVAPPGRTG